MTIRDLVKLGIPLVNTATRSIVARSSRDNRDESDTRSDTFHFDRDQRPGEMEQSWPHESSC